MRHYKINDRSFKGFNKDFTTPHDVVLALWDGELEVWAVDGVDGFAALIELYKRPTLRPGVVRILGRYKPEYFRGVICPKNLVDRNPSEDFELESRRHESGQNADQREYEAQEEH